MSKWEKMSLEQFATINPAEKLKKGTLAPKISMDVLRPYTRDVPVVERTAYAGGSKFRNRDTIMARITPCLENGKIAMVNGLNNGEIGFGSTEFIVFRAIPGISDPDFLYYLICSPYVRNAAIKSMVGSSGRQRIQTEVLKGLIVTVPDIITQKKIGKALRDIDDKILANNKINDNLAA